MTGYKDDEIFLLSKEEYEKYKNNIPVINNWWWLRSHGYDSNYTKSVGSGGSIVHFGCFVRIDFGCVRPALKVNEVCEVGSRIIKYSFPWIVIGEETAIAEVPIAFRRFDKASNDYEKSEIRQFLLNWIKER